MRIKKNPKREKKAMSVSLYANLLFVFLELAMAVFTGSQAVLLDAVYDGIEFLMLLPSIFIIPLLYRPTNEKYPYGYMQLEAVFLVVKGVTMTAATVGLIFNSINLLFHGGRRVDFGLVAWFELSAVFLSMVVVAYLSRKNKAMCSPIIKTEIEGWKIDSIVSLGMAAAFFLPKLPFAWMDSAAPYLDPLLTMILSTCMLPTPIKTVVTGIRDLLLISPEEETVDRIKELTEPILNELGCRELHYEIVRTGRKLWISVYMTMDRDELPLRRFKRLQARCVAALQQELQDFYFELLPEIELDMEEVEAAI